MKFASYRGSHAHIHIVTQPQMKTADSASGVLQIGEDLVLL